MKAQIARDNLKAIVRAYCRATGQTDAQVSRKFYGNTVFLPAFFAGEQSVSIDKLEELIGAIKADWPEKAVWPLTRVISIRAPERRRVKLSPEKRPAA